MCPTCSHGDGSRTFNTLVDASRSVHLTELPLGFCSAGLPGVIGFLQQKAKLHGTQGPWAPNPLGAAPGPGPWLVLPCPKPRGWSGNLPRGTQGPWSQQPGLARQLPWMSLPPSLRFRRPSHPGTPPSRHARPREEWSLPASSEGWQGSGPCSTRGCDDYPQGCRGSLSLPFDPKMARASPRPGAGPGLAVAPRSRLQCPS